MRHLPAPATGPPRPAPTSPGRRTPHDVVSPQRRLPEGEPALHPTLVGIGGRAHGSFSSAGYGASAWRCPSNQPRPSSQSRVPATRPSPPSRCSRRRTPRARTPSATSRSATARATTHPCELPTFSGSRRDHRTSSGPVPRRTPPATDAALRPLVEIAWTAPARQHEGRTTEVVRPSQRMPGVSPVRPRPPARALRRRPLPRR